MTAARHKTRHHGMADTIMSPGIKGETMIVSTACAPLDRLARQMDETWGVDRLVGLVSTATAARYGKAMAVLNDAINSEDRAATVAAADNCIRGLTAMDAEARAAGHAPCPPDIWFTEIDGKHFGFVRDVALAARAQAIAPHAVIFTLREAVVALRPAMFSLGVAAVKDAFPGAQVTAIRQRTALEVELDDEIPF